jgi:hypothetical protein
MKTKPRIFVSVPDDRHLDNRRLQLKRAIISFVAGRGFEMDGFEPEQYGAGWQRTWMSGHSNELTGASGVAMAFWY